MRSGTEIEVICDMKLLRRFFVRTFLKVTNASELYYDYASLNFPIRKLEELPAIRLVYKA